MHNEIPDSPVKEASEPQSVPPLANISAAIWKPLSLPDVFKRIMLYNPFYIISAALLLYGIYRLSIDPGLFATETRQLLFNFFSLQFYEALLIGMSVFLFRRSIRHDSAVLVCLENILVLIPFILVSHAVFLGKGLAAVLCGVGFALVGARFASLKIGVTELNLPMRLLASGAVILGANTLFPFLFRSGLEAANESWQLRGFYCWSLVLPVLAATINLLPRPLEGADSPLQRRWMPLVFHLSWVTGTGAHLWSISYIDERALTMTMILPVAWVLAWTLCNRLEDLAGKAANRLRGPSLVMPLAPVFCALLSDDESLSLVFSFLNICIYGLLVLRRSHRRMAWGLAGVSAATSLAILAQSYMPGSSEGFSGMKALLTMMTMAALFHAARSRDAKWGLVGALACSAVVAYLLHRESYWTFGAIQSGFVFVMLHSLRWNESDEPGVGTVRWIVGVVWALHAYETAANARSELIWVTITLAGFVLSVCVLHRVLAGGWTSMVVPLSAIAVMLGKPLYFLSDHAREVPAGVAAILGSFALLALGTVTTLWRHKRASMAVASVKSEDCRGRRN